MSLTKPVSYPSILTHMFKWPLVIVVRNAPYIILYLSLSILLAIFLNLLARNPNTIIEISAKDATVKAKSMFPRF